MPSVPPKLKTHLVQALWISGFFLVLELFALFFKLNFFALVWKTTNVDFNASAQASLQAFLIILAAHAIIFVLNVALLVLFNPNIWAYALAFVAYSLFYNFLYYPQLIEDLRLFNRILPLIDSFRSLWVLYTLIGLLLLTLAISISKRLSAKLALQIVSLLGLAYFLLLINDPYNTRRPSLADSKHRIQQPSKPDILFLGIDGLRPDTFDRILEKGSYPATKRFVSQSHLFKSSYAPIARTHPVYHSIFWGKNPAELEIRTNNHPLALDTDKSLAGSLLESFKAEGYQITVGLNDSSFSYYTPGKIFDDVMTPQPGYHTISLPRVLRDRLFFSWFNNRIGQWIAPEIIGNGAYTITHWPQHYQEKVLGKINQRRNQAASQLMFFHNTKIHWPGSNQYPYLTISKDHEVKRPLYDSSQLTDITENPGTNFSSVKERYIEIYEQGVRQLLDQYIEPILSELENSGALKNSVVVLFSDHGESFYGPSLLPFNKVQGHGSLLSYGEDSNHQYLAIRYPDGISKIHEETFSLSQVLPEIRGHLSQSEALRTPYVPLETDYWPADIYPGSFFQSQNSIARNLFDSKGIVYLANDPLTKSLKEKQRGFVEDGVIYSLLPSEYGYYLHVSPQSDRTKAKVTMSLDQAFQRILEIFPQDRLKGFLPPLVPDKVGSHFAHFKTVQEHDSASTLQYAIEENFLRLKPASALQIFEKILNSEEASPSEKSLAKDYKMKICYSFPDLMDRSQRIYSSREDTYFSVLASFRCAAALRHKERMQQLGKVLVEDYYPQLKLRQKMMIEQYLTKRFVPYTDIDDSFNVAAALRSRVFKQRGPLESDFERLNQILVGIDSSEITRQEFAKKLDLFFTAVKKLPDFGTYGLLDSWYHFLTTAEFTQKTDDGKARSLILYRKILENDPYVSLELLRHAQQQISFLIHPSQRRDFMTSSFELWADTASLNKREEFKKLWLEYLTKEAL